MRPILIILGLLLCTLTMQAQSPPGINYQGVARDSDGKALSQKDIAIRISIVKDNNDGVAEYTEVHSVKTNSFGLFTLVIGEGAAITGDFQFISWALGNKWLRVEMDPDGGNAFRLMGSQELMSVPYAFYSKYAGSAPGMVQDLSLSGDKLKVTNNPAATEVDLAQYKDNTDAQVLSVSGAKLAISNGNNVDLTPFLDNTDNQQLTLSADKLSLTNNAAPIDLARYLDNTDNQDLALNSNILSLTNDATTVDLTPYLDNTDNQQLTLNSNKLSLTNNSTPIDLSGYLDNTDNQQLTLNSNKLSLTNNPTPIDLSGYLDNTDNQQLTLNSNKLSLTNNPTPIDLSGYLDNTDNQQLTLNSNKLSLTNNPTPIDLSGYLDNTDNQQLTLNSNKLSLTNNPTPIDLSGYLDNTDNQNLGNVLTQGNDAGTKKITNLGTPTANTDATTKQYVDSGDAALSARISSNYAFKAAYTYSQTLSVGNDITLPLTDTFDDFGVVSSTSFTATVAGTYLFVLDGSINNILGGPTISLLYNGTKNQVAVSSTNGRYNSTFMFQLTVGQTVSVVADGLGVGYTINGSFYGYKLL